MVRSLRISTQSPEETRVLGAALAPALLPGDLISLSGDLGAGKTVLVQGLATALGAQGRITSPTFTIVHEYEARYPILHLDIYRLNSFQELLDIGFEEFLDPNAIVLLEWGDAVEPLLPRSHLRVELRRSEDTEADDVRIISFRATGEDWIRKIDEMRATADALLGALADEPSDTSRFEDVSGSRDHRGQPDDIAGEG